MKERKNVMSDKKELTDAELYGGMDPSEDTLTPEEKEFLVECSEEENALFSEAERLGIFGE